MELLSFYINCFVIFILVFQGFRDDSRASDAERTGLLRYRDLPRAAAVASRRWGADSEDGPAA